MTRYTGAITDVPGVRTGSVVSEAGKTGCTVILPPDATAVAGLCTKGSAPANKELDLIRIDGITETVNAILLTGGSAFGLDSSTGVMKWLEEHKLGFDAGVANVPLVPTFSIFDLAIGDPTIRPDAAMGYQACENLSSTPPRQGKHGVGMGATVGKLKGMDFCSPSGLGTASAKTGSVTIGALGVSNAFGDLVDSHGQIQVGAKDINGHWLNCSETIIKEGIPGAENLFANCTFAVIATDMKLNRKGANKVAEMAMAGLARTLHPAFTMFDFDAVVVLSCGEKPGDLHAVGTLAADLVQASLLNGALAAN